MKRTEKLKINVIQNFETIDKNELMKMKGGGDPPTSPSAAPADATYVAKPIVPPIGGYPSTNTTTTNTTPTIGPSNSNPAKDAWNNMNENTFNPPDGDHIATPIFEWLMNRC
jgi:hypothetical protein